jgi:hypothetical protein
VIRTRVPVAVALLVLALSASGCASSTIGLLSPPSTRPSIDPGWNIVKDGADRYSIAFPPGWEIARHNSPTLISDLTAISGRHPEVGTFFTGQLSGSSRPHLRLLGANPSSISAGFIENVSVVRVDVGPSGSGPSLDAAARSKLDLLTGQANIVGKPVSKRVHISAGDAGRIDYAISLPYNAQANVASFLILVDQGGRRVQWELTAGSTSAIGGALEAIINTFVPTG